MKTVATTRFAELIDQARAAERTGEIDLALDAYEQAFKLLGEEGDAAAAATMLRRIGTLHRRRGNLELAEEAYQASEAIATACAQHVDQAHALNCLAIVAQLRGRMTEAAALYEHARNIAGVLQDDHLCAMIDQNIGTLANTRGDVATAIKSYWSALKRFQAAGDEVAMVWALNNLGMANTDLNEFEVAGSCFDDAFEIADRLRDPELLGMIELNRAELYLKREDSARARECCDRAFEIFSRIESRGYLGETYKFYGILYREMNRPALAIAHFQQAIEHAELAEDRLLEAETQSEWSLLELVRGDNRAALHRLNRAHHLFSELHARAEIMDLDGRLDRLEARYFRVMQKWAESIESKDRYTHGHCERVANYACMLAEAVGFKGRDLTWFRMGAYLHDVGKTAVSSSVLNKAGKLTEEEWVEMKKHTVVGDQIVAELDFPWDVRPIVRNHHELGTAPVIRTAWAW
jgi:putative nucleotidyltransferase with HDIG domain